MNLIYEHLARARRRYYQNRPHLRRRLESPVISIGNLTVGGSGKTPLAGEIARMLMAMGERPSILSRGYARQIETDGVVVVSDGRSVLVDEAHSGDEPQMLARRVPGAAVLVCPSRYLSGRLAETRLGCTVHVLDDGFQHFELSRDVDLLVAPDSLTDVRTLPGGRFREPLDAASAAAAVLVEAGRAPQGIEALNVPLSFEFRRALAGRPDARSAFAFAGIARPERFYDDLENAGWRLTGRLSFRDHHRYSARDLEAIAAAATASGAEAIVTTEKDLVRLPPQPFGLPVAAAPLEIEILPPFAEWLSDRLQSLRRHGAA